MDKRIKADLDYPIEDVLGDEIQPGDVYFMFGQEPVLEENLKVYLIKNHQVPCYRAM